jgi:hypothetical protein
MKLHLRHGVAGVAALTLTLSGVSILSPAAAAQDQAKEKRTEYAIKVMPPGGPAPRLADGHPDFSGQWFPNGAGQGVSGRFGVDPAALGTFDRKLTQEERPSFQPWAAAKIKAMTPTELELSKSSVNCLPRGVPAIWLQNPYTTMIVHKPGLMAQLYEVLNNWRVIHIDGRPLPKDPEPFFHGNSAARWEGDTLVVDSIGFDERTYIEPTGWFHSDAVHVTERYSRPSMNYLMIQITVDDPKVLEKPWKSVPHRWTLGDGEVFEFYCTNNKELEQLEKLRAQELQGK